MTWLITGGAGYIGAHVVRTLTSAGLQVAVLDDLSTGLRDRVAPEVPLVVGSVLDRPLVGRTLDDHEITGVVHLAGKKAVTESLERPLHYYRENVGGFLSLLEALTDAAVGRLVFSSSAAVYGLPEDDLVTEDAATVPLNPYGMSKLMCERLLSDVGAATGLRGISLRYFNVAGAAQPGLADAGGSNLIPLTFEAVSSGRRPQIFGSDYPTPDGTCVRDFIHVADLADAHVAAVLGLQAGSPSRVYNVGRGQGASVREVLATVQEVTGARIDPQVVGRRAGDPARVVADPQRIAADLGWRARLDLRDMVASAWSGWSARAALSGR